MFHATTILCVRKDKQVVMAGDGQVSLGHTVMKHTANKLRRFEQFDVIAGFAGSTADALTLYDRFEAKLKEFRGQLPRAAVEMAKDWRMDKYLRRLEAMLLVADKDQTLLLSGTGDVLEPEGGAAAIGSGGQYALSAARALLRHSSLDAKGIATESMKIAGEICIYTNDQIRTEEL